MPKNLPVSSPLGFLQEQGYVAPMNTTEMTGKFQDLQKRATDTARQVGQATDEYVRENTWASVGVAALLGCIVGFLLASRSDD